MQEYFAPGKLLLTGEYSVLNGAKALSVPTRLGQKLRVYPDATHEALNWQAFDNQGQIWLSITFAEDLSLVKTNDAKKAESLQKILQVAKQLGAQLPFNCNVETHLEFNRQWGLGSSSTLIDLVSQWLKVPSLTLFFKTLTGSGYDVATAQAKQSILYQLQGPAQAQWKKVQLPACVTESHFMYLGQKQNSAQEVQRFKNRNVRPAQIEAISALSQQILTAKSPKSLQALVKEHESVTASIIGITPIQHRLFPEFKGTVKSLGAWGGDFVWLLGLGHQIDYFKALGYKQIFTFNKLCPA